MVERHDEEQSALRRRSRPCLRHVSIERGRGLLDQGYIGLQDSRSLAVLDYLETVALFALVLTILAPG